MDEFIAKTIVTFFSLYINKIIVVLFAANCVIFCIILYLSHHIKMIMDETRGPETERLNPHSAGETYLQKLKKNYLEWSKRYRGITPWVHYYSILTTVFPLLGILGTVCGLLMVRANFSEVEGAFLVALSSTFYGLLAAITSKFGESFFAADIERYRMVYEIFTKDLISLEKEELNKLDQQGAPKEEDDYYAKVYSNSK